MFRYCVGVGVNDGNSGCKLSGIGDTNDSAGGGGGDNDVDGDMVTW